MIAGQLIEMLQLQDKFNCVVNPDWRNADYPWHRAVLVESVELMDHVGWKWWKKQEVNQAQAQLELVDIWHFIMSRALIEENGVIQHAALSLMKEWEMPSDRIVAADSINTPGVPYTELPLIRQIEVFGSVAGLTEGMLVRAFRTICEGLGLSWYRLYELYLSKNALNQFRQDNGYKAGTYVKIWNGREDNEVMQDIIDNSDSLSYQGLLAALGQAYAAVPK